MPSSLTRNITQLIAQREALLRGIRAQERTTTTTTQENPVIGRHPAASSSPSSFTPSPLTGNPLPPSSFSVQNPLRFPLVTDSSTASDGNHFRNEKLNSPGGKTTLSRLERAHKPLRRGSYNPLGPAAAVSKSLSPTTLLSTRWNRSPMTAGFGSSRSRSTLQSAKQFSKNEPEKPRWRT